MTCNSGGRLLGRRLLLEAGKEAFKLLHNCAIQNFERIKTPDNSLLDSSWKLQLAPFSCWMDRSTGNHSQRGGRVAVRVKLSIRKCPLVSKPLSPKLQFLNVKQQSGWHRPGAMIAGLELAGELGKIQKKLQEILDFSNEAPNRHSLSTQWVLLIFCKFWER